MQINDVAIQFCLILANHLKKQCFIFPTAQHVNDGNQTDGV